MCVLTKVIDRTRRLSSRALFPLRSSLLLANTVTSPEPARFASLRDIYADTLRLLRRPIIMAIGERSTLKASGAPQPVPMELCQNAIMIASLMLTCFVVAASNIADTHTHSLLCPPLSHGPPLTELEQPPVWR